MESTLKAVVGLVLSDGRRGSSNHSHWRGPCYSWLERVHVQTHNATAKARTNGGLLEDLALNLAGSFNIPFSISSKSILHATATQTASGLDQYPLQHLERKATRQERMRETWQDRPRTSSAGHLPGQRAIRGTRQPLRVL